MMLSPQAARMGTVHTTLRKIGMAPKKKLSSVVTGTITTTPRFGVGRSTIRHHRDPHHLDYHYYFSGKPFSTITTMMTTPMTSTTMSPTPRRFKSSQAAATVVTDSESDTDDEMTRGVSFHRYEGHASAAATLLSSTHSTTKHAYEEPWMINLHRGNNNEWLSGPRNEKEWFTGLAPRDCPGKGELLFWQRIDK